MIHLFRNIKLLQPQVMLVVVALCALTSCVNDLKDLPDMDAEKAYEVDRAEGVTFYFGADGKTKAKLYARNFVRNDKAVPAYVDLLDSVHVDFYDDTLKIINILDANNARFYPQANDIIAYGNVVVQNASGEKMYTEELIWNDKAERIYTEKPVKIDNKGNITTGVGMEANQSFTWIRIYKQRGTMPVDKEKMGADD